jgi:hypothetical protein
MTGMDGPWVTEIRDGLRAVGLPRLALRVAIGIGSMWLALGALLLAFANLSMDCFDPEDCPGDTYRFIRPDVFWGGVCLSALVPALLALYAACAGWLRTGVAATIVAFVILVFAVLS